MIEKMKSWSGSFIFRFLIDFWQLVCKVAKENFQKLTFFIFCQKRFHADICTLIFDAKNWHFLIIFDDFLDLFWSFFWISIFNLFLIIFDDFWFFKLCVLKFIIFEELRRSYQILGDFLANLHTKDENISNLHKNP